MPEINLHHGDCLDVLADLPADHFDAVVTDPPYHLTSIVKRFGGRNAAPAQHGTDGLFQRGAKGFMGQTWDGGDIAFRPETWAAVLRVMKPGAHLVAFNHSRTFHHMALAIEAAGFEVRDAFLNLYDTGAAWSDFLDTLSPDQGEAMSRALASADAPLLAWLYGTGFPKSHDISQGIDKIRDDRDDVLKVTAWFRETRDRKGVKNKDIDAAFGKNGMAGHWTSTASQPAIPTPEQIPRLLAVLGVSEHEVPGEIARLLVELNDRKGEAGEAWKNAPVIGQHAKEAQAARWRADLGQGRALPAGEIRGAATPEAEKWQGWGTALKPAFEPICLARKPLAAGSVARQHLATGTGGLNIDGARIPAPGKDQGRWPANVTTDGSRDVLARFPVDTDGSVARFFYSAKADAADRAGSDHPTVKPQALMRWLVRLTTARGGLVLDPFGGSGSTAWAAATEGRDCVLIERHGPYAEHIRRRIAEFDPNAADQAGQPADAPQPDLFGA